MYRSSNKLSILYRLIFFGSLYVSFQPVKGKDQVAVGQRLTLVCSGSYQGTLYFKKMRHEQFVGIADDNFKVIVVSEEKEIRQLLQRCQSEFARESKEIAPDKIKVAALIDKGYKGYWNQKIQSLNQISSSISPLKFQGLTYWTFLTKKELDSIVKRNQKTNAHLMEDPHDTFADYDGDKKGHVSYFKLAKYFTTLAYTHDSTDHILTENRWFNEISVPQKLGVGGKLYLGALPLVDMKDPKRNYLAQIYELGIDHILSMVEPFEIQVGLPKRSGFKYLRPVSMTTWKSLGVDQLLLPNEDFNPVSHQSIGRAVEYLDRALLAGKKVYVHCKAGRGRSATVVVAYFMVKHGMSFDDAYELVKSSRRQVQLNAKQEKAVKNFRWEKYLKDAEADLQ